MKVKICGLKTKADVDFTVENGADFIGFVFAPSNRQVKPKAVKKMTCDLASNVKKVGVFVNPTLDQINTAIEIAGLDIIQLHGNESPTFVQQIKLPTIKAFKVKKGHICGDITAYSDSFILLDAPGEEYAGGSGSSFDWEQLTDARLPHERLMIAGGLNAVNVAKAICTFNPYAVDVSSGVETAGSKDQLKIKKFIYQAKRRELI